MGSIPRSRSDKRAHAKGDDSLFVDGPRGITTGGDDVLSFVSLQPPESLPLTTESGLEASVQGTLSTASSFSRGSEGTPPDRLDIPLDELPMPKLGKKRRAVERREERRRQEAGADEEPWSRTAPYPRELPKGLTKSKRANHAEDPRLRDTPLRMSQASGAPLLSNETVLDYLIKSIARVLERFHQRLTAKNDRQEMEKPLPKRPPIPNLQRQTRCGKGSNVVPGKDD